MARKIALTKLNATTMDILNTIRNNANFEYQQNIPLIDSPADVPTVGEILYGYPALANQFINALVNRIALVRIQSATYNNPYRELKKGFLDYGETVEEVFVNIVKALEYSPEKGYERELKRYTPDAKSAFHVRNWRVIYPVTIEREELRAAFLSIEGVTDMIERIVQVIYTAAEYDEWLLFKYLLIKGITHGRMRPVAVDLSDTKNAAIEYRAASNALTFMSRESNAARVLTATPKDRQYIFMDSHFNAQFDVEVLAAAFNMEKADFMGRLHLIDDFTTFDNDRFSIIKANTDMIEDVTPEELELMASVNAVLVDSEFFQVYDNLFEMRERDIASTLGWNYFLHVWKVVSTSPFANALVFVDSSASIDAPATVTFTIKGVTVNDNGKTIVDLGVDDTAALAPLTYNFVTTQENAEAGVAVHAYGGIVIPDGVDSVTLTMAIGDKEYTGTLASPAVGGTVEMSAENP